MADKNNDQSLINNYNNRNNNISSNSDVYLEQLVSLNAEMYAGIKDLIKEFRQNSKIDNNNIKKLNDSLVKLSSNVTNQAKVTAENNKKTKEYDKNAIIKDNKIRELNKTLAKFDSILIECSRDYANISDDTLEFFTNQRNKIKAQLDNIKDLTDEEIAIKEDYNKVLDSISNNSERQLKAFETQFGNTQAALITAINSVNEQLKNTELEQVRKEELQKELKYLERQRKINEDKLKLEQSKNNFTKHIDLLNAEKEAKRIRFESQSYDAANKLAKEVKSKFNTQTAKRDALNKSDEYRNMLASNYELSAETQLFNEERNALLAKIEKAILDGNDVEYETNKNILESYKATAKALADKGSSSNTIESILANYNATNYSSGKGIITNINKTKLSNAISENDEVAKLLRSKRTQNLQDLSMIQEALADENYNGNKTDLKEQEKLLNKENNLIDYATTQLQLMFENIANGDIRRSKINERNVKKTLERINETEDRQGRTIEEILSDIKQTYQPKGTITNLLIKGTERLAKEVLNYYKDLQINALQELQSAYEGTGMNIAKQNLYTRYDVANMMGDIGTYLEDNNIKGLGTDDVLSIAENLANAGITEQNQLREMAIAMAKAGAVNPNMKAAYMDEANIRMYYDMYQQEGAEAFGKMLDEQAQNVYSVTTKVGNSFWAVNGNLTELESTLVTAREKLNLTSEEFDNMRKSVYSFAGVVGTDTTDVNAWVQNFLDLKEGLRGDALNVIQGTTYGQDIVDAIHSGDLATAMSDAYASLLSFDNTNGYSVGYETLMKELGIDSESLDKVRNNQDYWTNGQFDVEKFKAAIQSTYDYTQSAEASELFNKTYNDVVVTGKAQTYEQQRANEVMNEMSGQFSELIMSDFPDAVKHEIAAINFASDAITTVINTSFETLIGFLQASSAGNILSNIGGGGGLGSLLSGAGAAGPVAAGIMAFGGGLMIGNWLDDTLHISEWASEVGKNAHATISILDNLDEYVESNLPATTEALQELNSTMEESNNFNSDLTDLLKERVEQESKVITEASGALNIDTDSGPGHPSEEDTAQAIANGYLKEANVERVGAYIAGGALKAKTADEKNTYIDNMLNMLRKQGWSDTAIDEAKEYISDYYEGGIKGKEELDSFNAKFGPKLYEAYQLSKELEQQGDNNAWENALRNVIGEGYYYEQYHEAGVTPEIGKDIEIDDTNKTAIVLPGVYDRANASYGDVALSGGYLDYKPENWGRFATGLDEVPYDAYPALLDKGEKVLTSAEADLYDNMITNGLLDSINQLSSVALINSNITSADNTPVVNSINNQTSNVVSIMSNIVSLLQVIANNSNRKINVNDESYFTKAVLSRSLDYADYVNPSIYK